MEYKIEKMIIDFYCGKATGIVEVVNMRIEWRWIKLIVLNGFERLCSIMSDLEVMMICGFVEDIIWWCLSGEFFGL